MVGVGGDGGVKTSSSSTTDIGSKHRLTTSTAERRRTSLTQYKKD